MHITVGWVFIISSYFVSQRCQKVAQPLFFFPFCTELTDCSTVCSAFVTVVSRRRIHLCIAAFPVCDGGALFGARQMDAKICSA